MDGNHEGPPLKVALLLPGQGSQHVGMGKSLYGVDEVFTTAFLRALALSKYGKPAFTRWKEAKHPLDATQFAQPLIFAMDYALAQMVMSWGVRPSLLLGHSAGELVAAVVAGVVSLRDGVRVMDDRVDQSPHAPAGGMLAVACSAADFEGHADGSLSIAADNAPTQIMIAGQNADLERIRSKLTAACVVYSTVPALTPFHSPAMHSVAKRHLSLCRSIPWREPRIPIVSGYTGNDLAGEALQPEYWAHQVKDPVLFRQALATVQGKGDWLFLEAGAGATLTAFAKRTRSVRSGTSRALPLLADERSPAPGTVHPSTLARLAVASSLRIGTPHQLV